MERIIRWSPEAIEDLSAIAEFIARDSGSYARSVVSRLLSTARSLPERPFLGRIVPETSQEDIRERFVFNYRLIYRVREDHILVVAIIHGSRHVSTVIDKLSPS